MKRYGEMTLPGISEQKMQEIIKASCREDTLESAVIHGIQLALAETERLEGVLRRREGCVQGHVFLLHGDSGMVEAEMGGGSTRMKWRGSGDCENCDAHLGVTYKEKM